VGGRVSAVGGCGACCGLGRRAAAAAGAWSTGARPPGCASQARQAGAWGRGPGRVRAWLLRASACAWPSKAARRPGRQSTARCARAPAPAPGASAGHPPLPGHHGRAGQGHRHARRRGHRQRHAAAPGGARAVHHPLCDALPRGAPGTARLPSGTAPAHSACAAGVPGPDAGLALARRRALGVGAPMAPPPSRWLHWAGPAGSGAWRWRRSKGAWSMWGRTTWRT
jgi:hypothetical protein